MYTIRQAARLTGVSEASLRAWERRYGVVVPARNGSGYRIYDEQDLAALSTMRRLVADGWAPAEAAHAISSGAVEASADQEPFPTTGGRHDPPSSPGSNLPHLTRSFLAATTALDTAGMEESLDQAFALGSFEHVVDTWLFPTLHELGTGWASGAIDVAAEHAASHAVHRRLSTAFEAAGSRSRGPAVVIGLPAGSQHDLGALAFATAIRRRGLNVLYLGANVPVESWERAARDLEARAAVLAVVTPADRPAALAVAERLLAQERPTIVCSGGAHGAHIARGVHTLAPRISAAALQLDELLAGADVS